MVKEFTSRKIIPTNTLKKDEKRNRISTEVIVESGVTNATVTGLDKINVKDILSPKEIENMRIQIQRLILIYLQK